MKTAPNIIELEAGRELDTQVALKACGWRWYNPPGFCSALVNPEALKNLRQEFLADAPTSKHRIGIDRSLPDYSTNRSVALDLFEHHFSAWSVEKKSSDVYLATAWIGEQMFEMEAETLPLAICRVVLSVYVRAQLIGASNGDS